MKSQALRSSRLTANPGNRKKNSSNKLSQSPTLASSYSQKSLWTHSYKNEPFPKELRKKLWSKKFEFDFSSDEEEQITAVVQEEEETNEKKIKRLPHFKLISDRGEFLSKRSRIKSEVQFRCREKCKSVESLKCLPQVQEEKKEEDELKKLERSKLCYFKDRNQFNQRKRKSSDSHNSSCAQKVQSVQNVYPSTSRRELPEQIEENQAQETKSVKLTGSIITHEIEKIIVDELDSRRRKEELKPQEIAQIIEEKMEEDDENAKITRLRQSLDKFETESGYLKQLRDEEVVRKSGKESDDEGIEGDKKANTVNKQGDEGTQQRRHHEAPLEREKLEECQEINECSSSGEEYSEITKLQVIKEEPQVEYSNNHLGNHRKPTPI